MISKAIDHAPILRSSCDNKSVHLKTRKIQCSAVVCYTHVHFPYIFFEQNIVKSIVQLTGVILL